VNELRGKVAVVTGGASGIGYALCDLFAREGMHVVMSDVAADRLEAAAERLRSASDANVLAVPVDVTQWEEVDQFAGGAVERFGAVHVLCNNAGVQRDGYSWEFTLEEWHWILGVNLWGTIHGIKAFVPGMLERGEPAHVVNTASVGGLVAFPRLAMYAAAKAGVIALSETLRNDLRERGAPIGVSVLCPGPTMSGLREHSRALHPGGSDDPPISLVTEIERTPAEDVAAQVLDAIRTGRFWIMTHPEYNGLIERRYRGIVETGEVIAADVF
jgi:NAD(P)-dependent dehydrogenase (short-subunit alcohol dehydrogenase family)